MRLAALGFLLLAFSLRAADVPAISVETIAAPSSTTSALGPSLTTGPDGVVWLTWLEKSAATTALRCATFDAASKRWTATRTIAQGTDLNADGTDFPTLTVGADGHATAAWFVNNPPSAATTHQHHGAGYRAKSSRSTDGGKTWSAPELVSREASTMEFLTLVTLADGRVLATWLDGRAKKNDEGNQQLFSRILGASGPDTLVDPRVCDCCHTTLTAFPDGTALLAYRGRSADEVRDIRVTRFRGNAWNEPRPLNSDDWRINGCPVNGPQLASDGGRVAATWFTAADNDPRVVTSFSPDAGARFLMPLRLTEKKTLGRVATLLLHDSAVLATFVDADGGLWLRRVSPDFVAKETVSLAAPTPARVTGFPRLALVRDYVGGKDPAQFLAAFTREGVPGIQTLLVSVPESDLLEAEKNCDCAPSAEQLQGFPIRGTMLSAQSADGASAVRVKHFEVPGIFAEGAREFKVAPELLAKPVEPGRQFLGRIERRDGAWWLFDVRYIAMAPK